MDIIVETETVYHTKILVHGTRLDFSFFSKPKAESVIAYIADKVAKIDIDSTNGDLLFYKKGMTGNSLSYWFCIKNRYIPDVDFELGEYETAKKSARIILNADAVNGD